MKTHNCPHCEKEFGCTYTDPQYRELSDDEVIIPRELAENYLQVTEVPRFKRILKAILERAKK